MINNINTLGPFGVTPTGVVQGAIRYCPLHFLTEQSMRLFELFEARPKKKVQIPAPRNFVAKHAKTSGAGSHSDTKYSRKEKHKSTSKDSDE
jgi:hypothetical protein